MTRQSRISRLESLARETRFARTPVPRLVGVIVSSREELQALNTLDLIDTSKGHRSIPVDLIAELLDEHNFVAAADLICALTEAKADGRSQPK